MMQFEPDDKKIEENLRRLPKEDPDDTTSFEGANSSDSDVEKRRRNRSRRNAYKRFKSNNKVAWRNFNCAFFFGSLIMASGSYEVIQFNKQEG